MSSTPDRQRRLADLLFVVQLTCALIFGGSQTLHMLESTEGLNVSFFLFWALFLVINLGLSVQAHRAQPSRVTRQTVFVYSLWTLIIAANLGALAWHGSNLAQVGGGLLLVPQFTLAADTRSGTRPSFTPAAPPALARELFDYTVERARTAHPVVETGRFGADMKVALVNDGPVTFWLQTAPAVQAVAAPSDAAAASSAPQTSAWPSCC